MRQLKFKDKVERFYSSIEDIVSSPDLLTALKPSERLTVTQFAEKYVDVSRPGMHLGKWSSDKTPYVVEPQDSINDMRYRTVVFVGPARSGKSMISSNFIYYTQCNNPSPMQVVCMSKSYASSWSKSELDSVLYNGGNQNEPTMLGSKLILDNDLIKKFLGGGILYLSWPTPTELSGKTVKYVIINDYDNFPSEDVDGKGSVFSLASKRMATYGTAGCTYVEGSPAHQIKTSDYHIEQGSHEAPPTTGILSLYNNGDRRKWYFKCVHCGEYFEASWDTIKWNDNLSSMTERAQSAGCWCPHCGSEHKDADKSALNSGGVWLRDGETIDRNGVRGGNPRISDTASFWLTGVGASLTGTEFTKLVARYLEVKLRADETGREDELKAFFNTDLGLPYLPKAMQGNREAEPLMNNRVDCGESDAIVVPADVLALITTVDVQSGGRSGFVVQVHGITVNNNIYVIDRYNITKSLTRLDANGHPETLKPDSYVEDWDALGIVHKRIYKRADGKFIRNLATGVDTGGASAVDAGGSASSVTNASYKYYLDLMKRREHNNFYLLKGRPSNLYTQPIKRSDIRVFERWDIPLYLVNSNVAKDLSNTLIQRDMNPVMYAYHLRSWFFSQLVAEVRTDKGWIRVDRRKSNESFDLLTYAVALRSTSDLSFDASNPPDWILNYITNEQNSIDNKPKITASNRFKQMGSKIEIG